MDRARRVRLGRGTGSVGGVASKCFEFAFVVIARQRASVRRRPQPGPRSCRRSEARVVERPRAACSARGGNVQRRALEDRARRKHLRQNRGAATRRSRRRLGQRRRRLRPRPQRLSPGPHVRALHAGRLALDPARRLRHPSVRALDVRVLCIRSAGQLARRKAVLKWRTFFGSPTCPPARYAFGALAGPLGARCPSLDPIRPNRGEKYGKTRAGHVSPSSRTRRVLVSRPPSS